MIFDEAELFAALHRSGVRGLLIGRRALIALGAPLLTSDYDLWIHIDDIERLNAAVAPLDFAPNYLPQEARTRGRYVLEDHVHVDVMVARAQSTRDGDRVHFDDVWSRRLVVPYSHGIDLVMPAIPDLVRTKKWAMRPKDVADIQWLEVLELEDDDQGNAQ